MQATAVDIKPRDLVLKINRKQSLALHYLRDDVTEEVLFGGGAGGSKSYLGCLWAVLNCYNFPGTRGLIGRAVLKQLKQSTLLTFFEVCEHLDLKQGKDYIFNAQENIITFPQVKSTIFLKDLAYYPSDPEFDSLGSTEYTWAFIDEASQITAKAKSVVKSRLRYKLDQYKLIPKMLLTCNPTKNFLYAEFYKPAKEGTLPKHRQFVKSLVSDNPFISRTYVKTLRSLDKNSQERLLRGNWEYDDDPAALIDYEAIIDMFTNIVEGQVLPGERDEFGNEKIGTRRKYIVCDVARMGRDKTVITLWRGLECYKIEHYGQQDTAVTATRIKQLAAELRIPYSNILIDEDGIGGGVKDQIKNGCKGFIALTAPFKKENYTNLKSQCAYLLAKRINDHELAVRTDDMKVREMLTEELEQIKAKDIDKDGKLAIIPKEQVKDSIGRSPDFADCLLMRMYFEFKSTPRLTFV